MDMDERELQQQRERQARRQRQQEETRRRQRERERKLIIAGVAVLAVIVIVLLVLGRGLRKRNAGKNPAAGSTPAVSETERESSTRRPDRTSEAESQSPESLPPESQTPEQTPEAQTPEAQTPEAQTPEAQTPEPPPETPPTETAAAGPWNLEELDNTAYYFGYANDQRDERNYPTDWLYYENRWGQFNVDWVQDGASNIIYLTMDEGYPNAYTDTILGILAEKNVKATFFLTKMYLDGEGSPLQVQRMINDGHTLGNHTSSHPNMPSVGPEAETAEIMNLHNQVRDTFGYEMKLFRFPEGVYSAQSLGLVDNLGYKSVFWSYAYNDYSGDQPVDQALEAAVAGLHPGAVYLLHANSGTNTAMLAQFIDEARARGFEFGVYPIEGDSTRLK